MVNVHFPTLLYICSGFLVTTANVYSGTYSAFSECLFPSFLFFILLLSMNVCSFTYDKVNNVFINSCDFYVPRKYLQHHIVASEVSLELDAHNHWSENVTPFTLAGFWCVFWVFFFFFFFFGGGGYTYGTWRFPG